MDSPSIPNLPRLPQVPRPLDDPIFRASSSGKLGRFLLIAFITLLVTLSIGGSLLASGEEFPRLILIFPLGLILYTALRFRRIRTLRRLWATGSIAQGVLTGNEVTGTQVNNVPELCYNYRYTVENRTYHGSYYAPRNRSLTLTTGSAVGVAYDPQKPSRSMLLIDPRHLRQGLLP